MLNLSPFFPFPEWYNIKVSAVFLVEQPFSFWFSHCVCVIHFLPLPMIFFFKKNCMCFISLSNHSYLLWKRIDNDCWRCNPRMLPISGHIYQKLNLLNIHVELPMPSSPRYVPGQPACLWDSSQTGWWYQFKWECGKCCILSDLTSHDLWGEMVFLIWFFTAFPVLHRIKSGVKR